MVRYCHAVILIIHSLCCTEDKCIINLLFSKLMGHKKVVHVSKYLCMKTLNHNNELFRSMYCKCLYLVSCSIVIQLTLFCLRYSGQPFSAKKTIHMYMFQISFFSRDTGAFAIALATSTINETVTVNK